MSTVEFAFWFACIFVVYTYLGYPAIIHLLSQSRRPDTPEMVAPHEWPGVTIVIAVHNEERRIAEKVRNLRALDYPAGCLDVLFVSDGSTDQTDAVIAGSTGVRLLSYPVRQGKPHALNSAIALVRTPIVVFTDARQHLAPDAVRHLVLRLLQPSVGAVSGELIHREPGSNDSAHVGLYWRYEKWIRQSESRYFSTVGVTGALYAIRHQDYSPIPTDTLLDDFEVPIRILRRGKRVVLEGRARIYDELQNDVVGERKRKVRTLTGNFQAFSRNGWLFSPLSNPVFAQFVSHKVFRLMVPYALAVMLLTSMLADGIFYHLAAALQLLLYAIPSLGGISPGLRRTRVVSFISVFLELNLAAVLALLNFARGRLDVRWEKT